MGLLLLASVTSSSLEVVFGWDVFEPISNAHVAAQTMGPDAPDDGADEDCACLCACICAGAQLVVEPPAFTGGPSIRGATAAPPGTYRTTTTLPFPSPLERPPLA